MIAKILRIDLTSRSCTVEEIPGKIIKNYLGGRGLGAYLLYQYVPAKVDPLSEVNHLIFSGGPASGTPLPFSSRTTVNTKSPLTGLYLRGSAAGTFAHQAKKAGFWAIDISGIADSPVYIRISNQNVEFIDANHLWGIEPCETERVLLAAMSSLYLHQKIAVAVDEDVDIYDAQDVAWAIATRVNPEVDINIIPGGRGHPLDNALSVVDKPGVNVWHRLGSRVLIDATMPPTSDPKARAGFERALPPSRK